MYVCMSAFQSVNSDVCSTESEMHLEALNAQQATEPVDEGGRRDEAPTDPLLRFPQLRSFLLSLISVWHGNVIVIVNAALNL